VYESWNESDRPVEVRWWQMRMLLIRDAETLFGAFRGCPTDTGTLRVGCPANTFIETTLPRTGPPLTADNALACRFPNHLAERPAAAKTAMSRRR